VNNWTEHNTNADLPEELHSTPGQNTLAVNQAAALMGVTPQFLRLGLQQDRFPFGTAVKMKRWSYYINAAKFYDYLKGNERSEQSFSGKQAQYIQA